MHCPNCGTYNDTGVKFCANCGTHLDVASAEPPPHATPPPPQYQEPPHYQQPLQPEVVPPYSPAAPPQNRNEFMKFLGVGCLILAAIFLFGGLSCMRACFGGRRRYRRF